MTASQTHANLLTRLAIVIALTVSAILLPRPVSAGLIMRIDSTNDTFFIEGTDTGNAAYSPNDPFDPGAGGSYLVQFIHYFSTTVPTSAIITISPENLFVESATLPMYGTMSMITNSGQNYVFMDLGSGSGDITTLTGKGPSAAVSYAGLPAADIPVFESLIGQNLVLGSGSGYSPLSVVAVPEPATCSLLVAGLALSAFLRVGCGAARRGGRSPQAMPSARIACQSASVGLATVRKM